MKQHKLALYPMILFLIWVLTYASVVPSVAHANALIAHPISYVIQDTTSSRGYTTTPAELRQIAQNAARGIEPYESAVEDVLDIASNSWNFSVQSTVRCSGADDPAWIDNHGGIEVLYAQALAYHLTSDVRYARRVRSNLQKIMTNAIIISMADDNCMLNFAWGTPELVASADLIEDYWGSRNCTGPLGTERADRRIGIGNCKRLFQNWLAKNPYYVISWAAESMQNNWGAASTNALAYIADYLSDRSDIRLVHRNPAQINNGVPSRFTPAEAYQHANELALDRMNGYRVDVSSIACDTLQGSQQSSRWAPVKSQITERGIIPDEARRTQHCNIRLYNGQYQNYPQIHLGNIIQQCELMRRRGDTSCFDNIDNSDLPRHRFTNRSGQTLTTSLRPGRGSIERAINAVIVDSGTEWNHDEALWIAYRYYIVNHRFSGVSTWRRELDRSPDCSQDVCFGRLTHGFAANESLSSLQSPEAAHSSIEYPHADTLHRNVYTTITPSLAWSGVTYATGYRVEISTDPLFENGVMQLIIPDPSTTVTVPAENALPDGVYYWRVSGRFPDETWGPWSNVDTFVIETTAQE